MHRKLLLHHKNIHANASPLREDRGYASTIDRVIGLGSLKVMHRCPYAIPIRPYSAPPSIDPLKRHSSAGSYFITICAHQRQCLFGEIVDGQMRLNELGQIAADCWQAIPDHFPHTQLDTSVVMPNHLHGILVMIDDRSYPNDHPRSSNSGKGIAVQCPNDHPRSLNDHPRSTNDKLNLNKREFGKMIPGSLPTIDRSYKSATTKYIASAMKGKIFYSAA